MSVTPNLLVRIIAGLSLFVSLAADVAASQQGAKEKDPAAATWTDPEKAAAEDPDSLVQGEYGVEKTGAPWGVQVVAMGAGAFDAWLLEGGLPGFGWARDRSRTRLAGTRNDGAVRFTSDDGSITATIVDQKMSVLRGDRVIAELPRIDRKSPTLEAKPPAGAIVLFDGSSADAWTNGLIENGLLANNNSMTKQQFQDYTLHIEFRTPWKPFARGQQRGNSGVYHQGRFETQVLDSFGLEGRMNETGGVYSIADPLLNMCLPPLTWQTYDIDFTAAKFDAAGGLLKPARITVTLDGVVVQNDLELPKTTTAAPVKKITPEPGPLYLQHHNNPVYYRNIWIIPKTPVHTAHTSRPNIVLIMADDQGWGDTGYNGHPVLKTPHLDDMAKSGLRMNRFYTAHFNCSPTRGSVMTGRHPGRYGTFSPGSPIRIQELTVAKVLQSAGYATGHFGKWHLNGKNGDKNTVDGNGRAIMAHDPLSPGRLGFDEWVSADNFFDLDPVLGRNGVPEKFHGDSSDVTTDKALKFIRRQAAAGKPFLSVVWFGSPHSPHKALPADRAAYSTLTGNDQNYYGEIAAIDRNVGRLRAALRELNVADNTLVWYNSDNGGARGPLSTGQLRGAKGSLWEGGLRVPGIVEWPARVPTPFATDTPCSTLDIYPTVLEATGSVARNQIQPLDGVSLVPVFDRKTESRTRPIPFRKHVKDGSGHAVLLDWPWKLHTNAAPARGENGKRSGKGPMTVLYDVSQDPKETTDLAAQQPERVARMTAILDEWKASVDRSLAGADYPDGVLSP